MIIVMLIMIMIVIVIILMIIIIIIIIIIEFSWNGRKHPNYVSQERDIKIFCEDCKLAAPPGFFTGFGPRFRIYMASSPLGLLRMHNHNFLFAFLHTTQFSMITPHTL